MRTMKHERAWESTTKSVALTAIEKGLSLYDLDNNAEWWWVMTIDGEQLYMDNMNGEMLLVPTNPDSEIAWASRF